MDKITVLDVVVNKLCSRVHLLILLGGRLFYTSSRIEVQIACQNIRHVMHIVLTMGYHTLDLGEWVHGSLSLGPLLDSFLLSSASGPR